MKYYKAIHLLSEYSDGWELNEVENYDDFEIQKMNTEDDRLLIKEDLKISVDLDGGKDEIDYDLCVSGITIVSKRFCKLLFETEAFFYPVSIVNMKTKYKHYALKILNFYDCVDEPTSEFEYWTPENTRISSKHGLYKSLNRFNINSKRVGEARIFRLKKYFPVIIINENLKRIIEKNKITGIGFEETNSP